MNYNNLFIESELPQTFSQEELYSYFEKMMAGDPTAREEIIKHNIRLVINEVVTKFSNTPYDKQELISIGMIGLIKSVDTFDISKKIQFATYSTRCIDNEILMFMRKGKKYINDVSLSRVLGNDNEGNELTIEDTLYDEDSDFVADYVAQEQYRVIRQIVSELPERDGEIIKKYYGFLNDNPMTQGEIAVSLGISRSYVAEIIKRVLNKISLQLQQQGIIEVHGKKKNKMVIQKKLQTIYEYFKNYKKEEVDLMLSKLTDEERKLVALRYGDDLEHPVTSENWSKENRVQFYGSLVPKMKRLLSNSEGRRNLQTIYEYFKNYKKEEVDLMLSKLTDEERKLVVLRYGDDLEHPVTSEKWSKENKVQFYGSLVPKMKRLLSNSEGRRKNQKPVKGQVTETTIPTTNIEESSSNRQSEVITKGDYIKILERLKISNFGEMLQVLSPKEAVIICLKLGYIDGKYFSTDSVADFLGIEEDEVREITKKVLLLYKEKLNNFIDQAISYMTEEPIDLKKRKKSVK